MLKKESKLDMTFASFCELYEADRKPRLKASTWETKDHMIRTKLLPYFGHRKIAEIDAKEVIAWQNQLMAYRDKDGNLFRISQTEEKLRKDKIHGAGPATSTHYTVGREVRAAISMEVAFPMQVFPTN